VNLETKVGFFVILVGAVLFALSTQLERGEVKEGYTLKVRFETVDGLEEKAPVRIAGVKVGQVERIDLEEGRALLVLRMESGVEVPADSRAELRTEGMLGEKYLAIIPGKDWAHRLVNDEAIGQSVSQQSLDELLISLGKLATDFGKITGALSDAFGREEGKVNLQAILANMRDLTANMKEIVARNDQRVDSIVTHLDSLTSRLDHLTAANAAGVTETVDNLRSVTGYTRDNLPKWGEDFDRTVNELQAVIAENRSGVKTTIDTAQSAAQSADTTFAALGRVAQKMDEGHGTIGRLVNDEATVDKLNTALDKIDNFLAKRDRYQTYVTFEGESLMDRGDSRGIFTVSLAPSATKSYLFEVVSPATGDETIRRTTEVRRITNTGSGAGSDFYPTDVTQTVVTDEHREKSGNVQFSAQIAQRRNHAGLRIGLKENSFGTGGDYYLAHDRIHLSLDAYDFAGDNSVGSSPHLKAKARWDLFTHLFLTAGYDNPLNDEVASAFLGGGVTFEDEDLKDLLAIVPAGLVK